MENSRVEQTNSGGSETLMECLVAVDRLELSTPRI
jgi:hypothetical protein